MNFRHVHLCLPRQPPFFLGKSKKLGFRERGGVGGSSRNMIWASDQVAFSSTLKLRSFRCWRGGRGRNNIGFFREINKSWFFRLFLSKKPTVTFLMKKSTVFYMYANDEILSNYKKMDEFRTQINRSFTALLQY